MSSKVKFSIVVHDPKIIEFFESTQKYKSLPNYNYLLVGKHDKDYNSEKIVQCDWLLNNIEDQKYYLAYTAWWALAHNPNLIEDEYDYVCLLEYDAAIISEGDVDKFCDYVIDNQKLVYGIDKMSIKQCFLERSHFSNLLENYLKHRGYREVKPNNHYWIVSNNVVFSKSFLEEYLKDDLTKDFFDFLKNDRMSGHSLERFLSVYCFLKNVDFGFVEPKLFDHVALDSHDTQGKNSYKDFLKTLNK